jgi:RNA-binding protein
MSLTEKQKKHLRRLGHALDPIVLLGNAGLTDGVVKETDAALDHHELIKTKARVGDRKARDSVLAELASRTQSELVYRIGNVGVLYRRSKQTPKVVLPD